MKNQLYAQDIQAMLLQLGHDLSDAEQTLTQLDSAIGDGDLGMTLKIGFREIQNLLSSHSFDSISAILTESADVFAEKAASTFGTLLTVMMNSAGKAAASLTQIGTREAADLLDVAAASVQRRGKAQLGDKTLLDALIPAVNSLKSSAEQDLPLSQAAQLALEEARLGAERTVSMKARAGRSGYLGDRTIGQKDPGAAAIVIILQSFTAYITQP